MAKKQQYQPLSGIDEDEGKEQAFIQGEGTSRKMRFPSAFALCAVALLVSVAVNILLLINNTRLHDTSRDSGRTKYSKEPCHRYCLFLTRAGGINFDTMVPFQSYSDYWNPNISDEITDANWDAIDTNPMAISLHDDFAKQVGLGPSTRFPWDTERSIYYIKGFHDLHCLVCHSLTQTLPPTTHTRRNSSGKQLSPSIVKATAHSPSATCIIV